MTFRVSRNAPALALGSCHSQSGAWEPWMAPLALGTVDGPTCPQPGARVRPVGTVGWPHLTPG